MTMSQREHVINRDEIAMDDLKRTGSTGTEESYILSSKDSQSKNSQSKGSMDEKLYLPRLPLEIESKSVTQRTSNHAVDLFAEMSPSQEESLSRSPHASPRLDDFDNSFSAHAHKRDTCLRDEMDDEAPLLESRIVSSSLCACMPKTSRKWKGRSKSSHGRLQESAKTIQRKYYNLYNKGHNPLMLEQTRDESPNLKQNTVSSASETSNEETAYNSSTHTHRTTDSHPNGSLHSGRWPRIDNSKSNSDSAHLRQVPSSEPLLKSVDVPCDSCLGRSNSNKTRLHSQFAKNDLRNERPKQLENVAKPMSVPYYTLPNPKRETLQESEGALLARRELWLHDLYLQESKKNQGPNKEPPPFYVSAHVETEAPKMESITSVLSSQQSKTSFARNLRLTSPGEYEEFQGDSDDSEERDEKENAYGYTIPYSLKEPMDPDLPIDNQLSTVYEEDEGKSTSMSSRGTRKSTQSKTKKLAEYLKRDGETNFDLGSLSREPSYADEIPIDEELLFDFGRLPSSPQFTENSANLLLQATKGYNITLYSQTSGLYGMRIDSDKREERPASPILEFHPEPKDQKSSAYAQFHPEPKDQPKKRYLVPTPTKEERAPSTSAELRSGDETREDTDCKKNTFRSLERDSSPTPETGTRCVHGSGQIILPTVSQDISELTEDIYSVSTNRKSPPTVQGNASPPYDGRKSPYDGRASPAFTGFEGRRSPRWMCQSRSGENDELESEEWPSDERQSPPVWKGRRSKKKYPWQNETEKVSLDLQKRRYQTLDGDQQQNKSARRWSSKKTRDCVQQAQTRRSHYRYRNNSSPSMEKQSLTQNDTLANRYTDLSVQRLEI